MDEDLGHLEDLTKKHGSNFLIPVQDTAHGDLWKVKKKKKKVSLPLKNVTWSEKMSTFLLKEDYDCGIFFIKKSENKWLRSCCECNIASILACLVLLCLALGACHHSTSSSCF